MSGESLRAMILRVASTVTVVLNGGNSSKPCQPSSKATRASGSKRPEAFDSVPRPRRRSRAAGGGKKSPAGVEGSGAGGRLNADERLITSRLLPRDSLLRLSASKLTRHREQNKNKFS